MELNLTERLAICYTCCGPTYRQTAYDKLKNYYIDDDNIYYCIITDDKSFFADLDRKNLIVNELKDFYLEFPNLEKNEFFLESTDKWDYGKKFDDTLYVFPFSTYRINILQAIRLGITNVAVLCTDAHINFEVLSNNMEYFFKIKHMIYNAVSVWYNDTTTNCMNDIVNFLETNYDIKVDKTVTILDAAARLFVSDSISDLQLFFDIWNDTMNFIYDNDLMRNYKGSYAANDEYILAPIYNALNWCNPYNIALHARNDLFVVQHDIENERFWRVLNP